MKKVLVIYPSESTFVRKDIEILSAKYVVDPVQIRLKKNVRGFIAGFLSYSIKVSIKALKSDYIFIWFADYHSLVPVHIGRIFRKKVIIVLGGYDIARLPKYNYGALMKCFRAWCVKSSVLKSYVNLSVSDYIHRKAKFIFPKGNFYKVYNALNDSVFDTEVEIGKGVITVARITEERDIYIKGIDIFIQVARQMPELNFTVVGAEYDIKNVIREIPDNVRIFGVMKPLALQLRLKESNLYCQFSKIESFGLAVLEAIACGCVPIVSRAGALPEVSGAYGYVINSVDEAVERIRYAQDTDLITRKSNALSVRKRFSVEKRSVKILSILEK